ncbi:PIR Superfamily Protein [Plasmodium ovale wallikeri]|uniref:PIR Superfamily Protein n=1 Tax=Plasmodium ovale wallikeri TaxID=864142 RepID=A0A1A9APM4_PLAOA|nr:PIR Superfamily Protein [Plasmodium ovale wallikeri]SBT58632.1 PIR Superfamily Protein [Plasmodium ovale wallikeri]
MEGGSFEGPEGFAEQYLSTLPSVQFYKEPGYDVCLLLNYWIYHNLNNIFGAKYDSHIAFANFQYIWSYPNQYIIKNTSCKEKCKYEIDVYKDEDWGKRKEFYEYCVDYDTIKGMITTYTEKCNDFYEYIKKKEELYKYFEHHRSSKPTECPKFYQDCKIYNPDILLSQLHCRDEMDKNQATAKTSAEHSLSEQELGHRSREHGPELTGIPDGFHITDTTPESSEIGTKVGHSVLGIAPVVLTATALYKYTPVGSWVRKIGGYDSNGVSDMDEFSSYTQESGDMFSDNSTNYISYQPI